MDWKKHIVLFTWKRIIVLFLSGFLLLGIAGGGFVFKLYRDLLKGRYGKVPHEAELRNIENDVASEVYSADGELLGRYYLQNRTNISTEDISPYLLNALLSTEDVRFYKHGGVDKRALVRVFTKTLIMGERTGGGSTISQQLAKNLFGRKRHARFSMPINKLREAIIAQRLENVYSKDEILMLYLNTVSFGEDTYGVHTAARRFFNTTPDSLRIEEAAVLVGALKSPTKYNPRLRPENATARRNIVIAQMNNYGFIEDEEKDSLQALDLVLDYTRISSADGLAPYFRQTLKRDLKKWCAENPQTDGTLYDIHTDGLKIYTTINARMQQYGEAAVREHLSKLQKQFFAHWKSKDLWEDKEEILKYEMKRSHMYLQLSEQGKSEKEIAAYFKQKRMMELFSYEESSPRRISLMDSIKYYQQFLHTGFMVIDPHTGNIKVWVGGIDHQHFQYDHVRAKRQVGSTFKPLVYGTAIEKGFTPCSYIPNRRKIFIKYDNWAPQNSDGEYGGLMSLKDGLTNSVNMVAANLIVKIGIDSVIQIARKAGITTALPEVPSIALGTADISLKEMIGAYTVLANAGQYLEPKYLLRIEDKTGKVIAEFEEQKTEKVFSEQTARLMTHMMKNVVNKGTATRLRSVYGLDFDIAGKTGTTQSHADGWFIGFTPTLLAGVWVGAENPGISFRTIDLGQGANMALPIWGLFMKKIQEDEQLKFLTFGEFEPLTAKEEAMFDCEGVKRPLLDEIMGIFGIKTEENETSEGEDPSLERSNPGRRKKLKDFFKGF